MNQRKVAEIVKGNDAIDGAGVRLKRVLGLRNVRTFDPFLMLDGFDSTNPDDYTKGFPWHPHRGIETITYLVSGKMEHGDSLGNSGLIEDLGCQWMTAGSGIIHQEMPLASERMLGLQLWVNMPRKDKMAPPAYGDITSDQVPVIEEEGATVRVIAGNYAGTEGAFEGKYVQVSYLDVELQPDREWSYEGTPNDETLFIYTLDGTLVVDLEKGEEVEKRMAVRFEASNRDTEQRELVRVKAGSEGARFVVLSGRPLDEPVAWGGPVVMNTKEELNLAFKELEEGTFIKEGATN